MENRNNSEFDTVFWLVVVVAAFIFFVYMTMPYGGALNIPTILS